MLSDTSHNAAGRKRRVQDDNDVIVEAVATDWAAASQSKRRRTEQASRPSKRNRETATDFSGPRANNYLDDVPPTSCPPPSSQAGTHDKKHSSAHGAAAKGICNCGNSDNAVQGVVDCSNAPFCKVGIYHKMCVGLGNRKETPGWRCFRCRPKPPISSIPPTPGAHAVSSSVPLKSAQPMQHFQSDPPPSEPSPLVIPGPPEPSLHPEQKDIVRCIETGRNVFYTGSAGTGKSTVLKAFVRKLKNQGKQVDIVAPSGIAALNVGGMTIYSYASWHPDAFKNPFEVVLKNAHGKKVRKRLCNTDVLVIDEISMVERDLLIRLDALMREAREGWKGDDDQRPDQPRRKLTSPHSRKLPFGGVQIVVTCDFCQLPPVKPFRFCLQCGGDELPGWNRQDTQTLQCKRCPLTYANADKWAFRSKTWEDCDFAYFELKNIHRQNDENFVNILQKCRVGKELSPGDKKLLTAAKSDPIGAVKLLPRRKEVDDENLRNFGRLTSSPRAYACLDVFDWRNKNEPELKKEGALKYGDRPDGPLSALSDHRFEENVQLKVGMLVILLVNLDFPAGLVNGSQGRIIRFEKYDPSKPVVPRPRDSSPSKGGRWSRKEYGPSDIDVFKEIQIRDFINRASVKEWPVVEFFNGVTRPIISHCQPSELGSEKPYSLIARTQIPILAAWAITIHKSQGMTLDRVIVSLANSFEREMVGIFQTSLPWDMS